MKLRHLLLGRKAMTNLDSILKSKDITCDKGPFCQSYGFPSSHIQIWELDHKEGWAMLLNCVVLEKSLESPSDCKEIKSLWNPKWNQAWIFIGRTNTKAEAPILWPPDVKNQLVGNDPDAGKDWGQENGMKEGKMVGCHHKLNGLEFEQTPGDNEGQGSLVWCSPWGHKVSNTTELLKNNNNKAIYKLKSQWKFALWCRELNPVLCNSLKGWDGVGGGKGGSRGRGHVYTCSWFMLMYCRNQHIAKQLSSN